MAREHAQPSPAEIITQVIVEKLVQGVRPWVQPWRSNASGGRPLRATGEPYRGVNTFWLWIASENCGYSSRYWMTYRQAKLLGGQVREGERSQFAIFYKSYTKAVPSAGDPGVMTDEQRRVLRSYAVFSADQIDGLPARYYPSPVELVMPADQLSDKATRFFDALPVKVHHGGDRAYYDRVADRITMPLLAQFSSRAHWGATLAHEAGHASGHPDRLNRTFGKRFGDAAYAFEELVAEMTAALLGADLGLPTDHLDDHAAYIGNWIAILKGNSRALMTAAARAEDAADFLLRATGISVDSSECSETEHGREAA